jgi:hypothetical protein
MELCRVTVGSGMLFERWEVDAALGLLVDGHVTHRTLKLPRDQKCEKSRRSAGMYVYNPACFLHHQLPCCDFLGMGQRKGVLQQDIDPAVTYRMMTVVRA